MQKSDMRRRARSKAVSLRAQAIVVLSFVVALIALMWASGAESATLSGSAGRAGLAPGAAQPLVRAQEVIDLGAGAEEKIRAVIQSQLLAFQRDDAPAAFSYASPAIKALFGNPERFIAMVKSGYRAVYRPSDVAFKELRSFDSRPAQIVEFVGPDGQPVTAIYMMEQQPDGAWLIDGVYLLRAGATT